MSVAIIVVALIKFKTFSSKAEFEITEHEVSSLQDGSIDLNQNEQALMFENHPYDPPYSKFVFLTAVHIRETHLGGTKVITPLKLSPCSERTIKGKAIQFS